jgi:NADH-quinone oxidoreductase subunit H
MKFALFFMAEYCNMVVASMLLTTLFFGGWQIPWLPRSVLEAHAGTLLPALVVGTALLCGWIAVGFFGRARREKGRYGDARDREPGLLGGVFLAAAVLALLALGLRPWAVGPAGASLLATLLQVGAFLAKVFFFCWFFIWVRWTLPRFRYDQLMALGWKVMLPLALANLVITAIVVAVIQ